MNYLTKEALRSESDRLLEAVKQRDFATFKSFFRCDLPFYAELPGGKVFNDIPSFIKSQETWFLGATGKFSYQVQDASLDGTVGVTTNSIEYSNVDASGIPFTLSILITFKFQLQDGKWFLIHDHNQVLEKR